MNVREAVAAARKRSRFQADAHAAWRRVAIALLCTTTALSVGVVALAIKDRPQDRAYAALPDGKLIPLTPLDEPIMTGAALAQWTLSAVVESLTFGHHDYRLRLGKARENFTDRGYAAFLAELDESQILARVRDGRQVLTAVARGAPVIVDTQIRGGRAAWELQFPVLLTYSTGSRELNEDLALRVLVARTAREERPAGIGIEQIIAERRGL